MAKKYDFTKYAVNTQEEKAVPNLEHEFRPIKDDPDIVVKVEYFKAGEKIGYADLKEGGTFSYNFRRIFERKVISIRGLVLTVTDKKTNKPAEVAITDPKVLVQYPDEGIIADLINGVGRHLIHGDELTEDEEGN